jgi:hypothetical protein
MRHSPPARASDASSGSNAWLLMAADRGVAGFVLINVSFRLFGVTLAWADELAILSMTLAAFVGASLMLRARSDPAMRLLHEVARPRPLRALRVLASRWRRRSGRRSPGSAGAGSILPGCRRRIRHRRLRSGDLQLPLFRGDAGPRLPYWWFYLIMPWFALTLTCMR